MGRPARPTLTYKYTREERAISMTIWDIKKEQRALRKRWLELDMWLNILNHKIQNKYIERIARKKKTKWA